MHAAATASFLPAAPGSPHQAGAKIASPTHASALLPTLLPTPPQKSATGVDKVRQAMQQLKKLQQAKEKVAAAEVALAKLQAAKVWAGLGGWLACPAIDSPAAGVGRLLSSDPLLSSP